MKFPAQKIIAFEGLDNCFKSTNWATFVKKMMLASWSTGGKECRVMTEKFPRYGTTSAIGVEKWLDGSFDRDRMKNYPEAINVQYSTDRLSYWFESVHGGERNIDKLYDDNHPTCFVFDRYNTSNAIYNPFVGNDTTVDDLTFDRDSFGIPQADIVVFFRMKNFDVLKSLIAKKKDKDENELDTTFIQEVWERAERAIAKPEMFKKADIDLIIIEVLNEDDTIKTEEQLSEEVWNSIASKLREMQLNKTIYNAGKVPEEVYDYGRK